MVLLGACDISFSFPGGDEKLFSYGELGGIKNYLRFLSNDLCHPYTIMFFIVKRKIRVGIGTRTNPDKLEFFKGPG